MKIIETKIVEISRRQDEQRRNTTLITNRVTMTIAEEGEEPETFITFQVDVEGWEHRPYEALLVEALLAARRLISEQMNPIAARLDNNR